MVNVSTNDAYEIVAELARHSPVGCSVQGEYHHAAYPFSWPWRPRHEDR
jgi:hypothetical protein